MEWWMLYAIAGFVIGVVIAGYFVLKRRMGKRMSMQQELVEQNKVTVTILVIEKRMDRIENASIPRELIDQMPKIYKFKKIPIVKAKIGPQVVDLLCEKDIYEKIPDKKNVKVELAGLFIAGISKVQASGKKGKGRR